MRTDLGYHHVPAYLHLYLSVYAYLLYLFVYAYLPYLWVYGYLQQLVSKRPKTSNAKKSAIHNARGG